MKSEQCKGSSQVPPSSYAIFGSFIIALFGRIKAMSMMYICGHAGWERMVLQILFLGPSDLLEPKKTFGQMSKKLIVSPIVKTLVFSKVPEKVCKGGFILLFTSWFGIQFEFKL